MAPAEEPQSATSLQNKQPVSTSPPVNISSQSHLDPGCYVKGNQLLTIEPNVVIHPRCRLYTDRGKITIHSGSILLERCIVGVDKELNPVLSTGDSSNQTAQEAAANHHTTIGPRAYLHSSVKLQPPCTIGECVVVESGVTILPNCTIGAHSKICAGLTLPPGTVIPDWTVVGGFNGQFRRKRQENVAEDTRLEAMARERQGVEALLKLNAAKNLTSAGGGSRSKREGIVRSDSTKG